MRANIEVGLVARSDRRGAVGAAVEHDEGAGGVTVVELGLGVVELGLGTEAVGDAQSESQFQTDFYL